MDWVSLLCETLEEKKAIDITFLDVKEIFPFADVMIFATGISGRHLISLCSAVERVARDHGEHAISQGKSEESWWIVISLPGIFLHLFLPEAREHYQLEKLWTEVSHSQKKNDHTP